MRILHVVETLDDTSGGLPAATIAIAQSHARLGHEVTIAAPRRPGDTHRGLDGHDVGVALFPVEGAGARFADSPRLTEHVREHAADLDLVHVHSVWNLAVQRASRAALRADVPVALSPHGSLDRFDLAKHRVAKQLLGVTTIRGWLDRLALVVCTSPREVELLVTYGAHPRTASVPLPPGPAPAGRPGAARARWGVPADVPLVAFVGRIDYKKGLDVLVEAFTLLDPASRLVLAGSGDPAYEEHVRMLVAASPARDRIVLTGWIGPDERADLLTDADVFALLSDRENYGIAAVEATQAGLPAVLSSEVFAGDVLVGAGAAVLAEREPVAAAAMLRSVLDPATNWRMRDAARRLTATDLGQDGLDAQYQRALEITVSPRDR